MGIKEQFSFRKFFGFGTSDLNSLFQRKSSSSSCGGSCSCDKGDDKKLDLSQHEGGTILDKQVTRREAFKFFSKTTVAASAVVSSSTSLWADSKDTEKAQIKMDEYFKSNYKVMNDQERKETISRLERLAKLETGRDVAIKGTPAQEGVLYGYAFNISKCQGYGNCIEACVKENNQDRSTNMQYIRIFEMENGHLNLEEGSADYSHAVPAEGHFYLGTQCFQCANPPCTTVCPVQATWQEPDGIVVVDYDWCIGCRYCEAACPYWARRFNWNKPEVPAEDINPNQHYLGNRMRSQGVMEKCTFCISRTREGRQPACAEACPTGARVFGNILDPDSEIRYILENKKVFRLKEDLGTEPKFWYYMD